MLKHKKSMESQASLPRFDAHVVKSVMDSRDSLLLFCTAQLQDIFTACDQSYTFAHLSNVIKRQRRFNCWVCWYLERTGWTHPLEQSHGYDK